MGIYLSTPCTDVFSEEGEGNGVRFAVGEMQGWRKNMEDAHIAIADLKSHVQNDAVDNSVSIFGVFDGHGGKEVAKFVKLKYPEILVNLNSFRAGDIELALRESFHKVDELLEDEQYHELLKELRALPNPSDASKQEMSRSNKNSPTNDAFLKAMLGELGADEEDEDSPQNAVEMIRSLISAAQNKSERKSDSSDNSDASDKEIDDLMDVEDGARELADDKDYAAVSTKNAFAGAVNGSTADVKAEQKSADSQVLQRDPSKREFDEHEDKSRNSDAKATMSTALTVVAESPDASSHGMVSATKSITRKPSQTLKLDLEDDETPMVVSVASTPVGSLDATKYNNESAVYGPPAAISGNSMVCKLKDHRIPAGCTAIVAFKVGNQLYVANAGDSRGVLCRQGGVAYALSDDHKPQSDTEMKRITSAGGFVNMVGRINGNLNLSRSLGDLKYKQLFKLSRAEQIITAEPDISVTTIEPTDRFFILACDGIWDCLTNQQAVDFVSAKLDEGMDVHQIVHEVCKHCVADDPRASTGIGSDNMTCMIVLLNQQV